MTRASQVSECAYCGEPFAMRRRDQIYCSPSCRVQAHRNGKRADAIKREESAAERARVPQYPEMPRTRWPSDNRLEIPVLDLNMAADVVDLPFTGWGSVSRRAVMDGTWHFYTDDERFSALWRDPGQLVNTNGLAVVEPNYSIHEQMPAPLVIMATYKKRALARWWQTFGIRVFVDLNVDRKYMSMNLLGVPAGWPAYATRGYSDERIDNLEFEYEVARKRAGAEPLFVVYGGGQKVERLARRHGWQWFPDRWESIKAAR